MTMPPIEHEPHAPEQTGQEREERQGHDAARRIARDAAEQARGAARRAAARVRARRSALLSAREMPGFQLGPERSDVRGWCVNTYDGDVIGRVKSIYIDVHTKAVRYLGVILDDAWSSDELLVPIAATRPQEYRRAMVLPRTSSGEIAAMPRVSQRRITQADEDAALAAFGLPSSGDGASSAPLELLGARLTRRYCPP